MQRYKNLTIIGTSHISVESIKQVKEILSEMRPEIIALELDKRRFFGLLQNKQPKIQLKDIRYLGLQAWLLNLFGAWAEKRLGKVIGTKPGDEMKSAIQLAAKFNSKIALIDRDIGVTLKRLLKKVTRKEKLKFLYDLISGLIRRTPEISFDLRKVPNERLIETLLEKVKKDYPSVYSVLIEERNEIMARKLKMIMEKNPGDLIVAVVGAGHEKAILQGVKS